MPALRCLHTHILLHMTTGQTSGVALCPHCNARHTTSNTYLIRILLRSIGGNSLCCTRCAIYPLYVLLCITSDLFKVHYCSALGTATRSNGCCNAKLAVLALLQSQAAVLRGVLPFGAIRISSRFCAPQSAHASAWLSRCSWCSCLEGISKLLVLLCQASLRNACMIIIIMLLFKP